MKARNITLLLAITALLVFAAVTMIDNQQQNQQQDTPAGQKLFQLLEDKINDVTVIEIINGEDKSSIENVKQSWQVSSRGGYNADFSKVKEVLLGIAGLEIIESKTKKADKYEKLGVQDPEVENANNSAITLKDSQGNTMASVIIGNTKTSKHPGANRNQQRFVRKIGEDQTWLVEGKINFPATVADWLVRDIINISSQRFAKITFNHPDESQLVLYKNAPDDSNFLVKDLPDDEELKFASSANSPSSGLSNLRLDDVKKAEDFTTDEKSQVIGTFQTFDGLIINTQYIEQEEKHYLKLNAVFDESIIVKPPATETPKVEPADDEAEATPNPTNELNDEHTPEAVKKEVDEINQNVSAWVYEIPSFKAANFKKQRIDVTKKKVDETASEELTKEEATTETTNSAEQSTAESATTTEPETSSTVTPATSSEVTPSATTLPQVIKLPTAPTDTIPVQEKPIVLKSTPAPKFEVVPMIAPATSTETTSSAIPAATQEPAVITQPQATAEPTIIMPATPAKSVQDKPVVLEIQQPNESTMPSTPVPTPEAKQISPTTDSSS